jgi:hypothetical protein
MKTALWQQQLQLRALAAAAAAAVVVATMMEIVAKMDDDWQMMDNNNDGRQPQRQWTMDHNDKKSKGNTAIKQCMGEREGGREEDEGSLS